MAVGAVSVRGLPQGPPACVARPVCCSGKALRAQAEPWRTFTGPPCALMFTICNIIRKSGIYFSAHPRTWSCNSRQEQDEHPVRHPG